MYDHMHAWQVTMVLLKPLAMKHVLNWFSSKVTYVEQLCLMYLIL